MRKLLLVGSALALFAAPAVLAEGEEGYDANSTERGLETRVDAGHDAINADADMDVNDNTIETQMDVNGDGTLETLHNGYTDAHPWVDAKVMLDGEQVAEIERVHYTGEDIDSVVIETGGVAEVGGREIELQLSDVELTAEADGEATFDLALTQADLDAMPDFDEESASDYPLSDNPAE